MGEREAAQWEKKKGCVQCQKATGLSIASDSMIQSALTAQDRCVGCTLARST